jgi:hypothetical protein
MNKLKFGLLFLCAVSIALLVASVHAAILARNNVPLDLHAAVRWTFSIVNALALAGAAYGIHRRWPVIWRLGWVAIAFSSLGFLRSVLSASVRIPQKEHPLVFVLSAAVGDVLVTFYWSWRWARSKDYFIPGCQASSSFWSWDED